jgi:outer membrane protein
MMRLSLAAFFTLMCVPLCLVAQKYAYIDSEYILTQITEYKAAQSKIDALAEEWSTDLTEKRTVIESMQRSFKAEQVLLTASMREEKLAAIKEKEAELEELQSKRFGYEGELFSKQQEFIKPLQDRIYEAVQKYAREKGYDLIFDRAGAVTLIYANGKFDKSDDILAEMGVAPTATKDKSRSRTPALPKVNIPGLERLKEEIKGSDDQDTPPAAQPVRTPPVTTGAPTTPPAPRPGTRPR